MKTITVERRAITRDYTHDMDSVLGFRLPDGRSHIKVPLFNQSANVFSEARASEYIDMDYMTVDYGTVGVTKRRERIIKTEEWGDTKIQFIEFWFEHYQWRQPSHVDGSAIS